LTGLMQNGNVIIVLKDAIFIIPNNFFSYKVLGILRESDQDQLHRLSKDFPYACDYQPTCFESQKKRDV
jgi:hypothetical protein